MSDSLRDVVVAALNKATGVLNEPEMARQILSGADVAFADLDLDSLTMFEMIMEIEEQLGIEMNLDAVAEAKGLDEVVAYLRAGGHGGG
jgi:acyl carrier protein